MEVEFEPIVKEVEIPDDNTKFDEFKKSLARYAETTEKNTTNSEQNMQYAKYIKSISSEPKPVYKNTQKRYTRNT